MKKKYLYTKEGQEAMRVLRDVGVMRLDDEGRQLAIDILSIIDHALVSDRETLRQYQFCFGTGHDWTDPFSARLQVAHDVLRQAEGDHEALKERNI